LAGGRGERREGGGGKREGVRKEGKREEGKRKGGRVNIIVSRYT